MIDPDTFVKESLIPWEIEEASKGLQNGVRNALLRLRNQDNSLLLARFILSLKHEVNPSDPYRTCMITVIAKLSRYCNNKPYNEITRDEVVSFLDTNRKSEAADPLHKWIGTYNNYLILISRFFKWLYNPDLPQKDRPKPEVIQNINKFIRYETSIYKPTDLWTNEDDQLFLSYCHSKRDKCYHMVARDTSCRPSEILSLKMKDIKFKLSGNRQYAEVQVNGKIGTRSVPLINSIPYVKDYLDEHPQKNNPNAYFIFGTLKSYGRKLTTEAIYSAYDNYQKIFFPKLLQDPKISPEDKIKIKDLLQKPWNPYIRRHTGLTEKSKILKEGVLRAYSGWSQGSKMHMRYVHYFGNEANESILEACGLKPKFEEIDKMKPTQCPNCTELNKIDSKFCVKCRMVLSYDSYIETVNKNQIDEQKLDYMQKLVERIENLEKQLK